MYLNEFTAKSATGISVEESEYVVVSEVWFLNEELFRRNTRPRFIFVVAARSNFDVHC